MISPEIWSRVETCNPNQLVSECIKILLFIFLCPFEKIELVPKASAMEALSPALTRQILLRVK